MRLLYDDAIKWKHFPRNWPFVGGIHRSLVNSPHKGQLRGALMFSLICVWKNDWVNNREAGDLRRYRAHYDVIVMNRGWHLFSANARRLFGSKPTHQLFNHNPWSMKRKNNLQDMAMNYECIIVKGILGIDSLRSFGDDPYRWLYH